MPPTVVGAYGRDYKSGKAALADWNAGKDFEICDHFARYDGKPINKEQADEENMPVTIRYNKLRSVVIARK